MIVHTYPMNDLREHDVDGMSCWCHPQAEECDGGTLIVHNSMDRREEYERGRKAS